MTAVPSETAGGACTRVLGLARVADGGFAAMNPEGDNLDRDEFRDVEVGR